MQNGIISPNNYTDWYFFWLKFNHFLLYNLEQVGIELCIPINPVLRKCIALC